MAKAKTKVKAAGKSSKTATAKKSSKPTTKTKSKAAEPKAKAKPAAKSSKKAAAKTSSYVGRKAGGVDAVKQAMATNNYGRFMFLSAKYPDRTIRLIHDPADWDLHDRHWPNPGRRHFCKGSENCQSCAAGDQPREYPVLLVATVGEDGKADRLMLWDPPVKVVNDLLAIHKRRGTLLDRDYVVERSEGNARGGSYTVMPEDKKARTTEIKALLKKDPIDIEAEFDRLFKEHQDFLNKADDEEDEDDDDETLDGLAATLTDDDDDEDEDDDADESDDDDEESDDEDDDEEADDDDDEDDSEDDEEEDEESDDDEADEADDDEEEGDDDDEEESDDDETEVTGDFKLKSFDTDEGTLHLIAVDGGREFPAVYYDEDEVDITPKKGAVYTAEIRIDEDDDWVVESIAAAKKGKGKK